MSDAKNLKSDNSSLTLCKPDWDSTLAKTVIELERLRVKKLGGPVPPYIFFQLKNIFQILESLGSARIEGNRTTLAEFVEKIIENPEKKTGNESDLEIFNIERAISFIEENIRKDTPIRRSHISEVHKILVRDLTPPPGGEGSKYPGAFRPIQVVIRGSSHVPPDPLRVSEYVDELLEFVNRPTEPQQDLLTTALAHHRMAWIHPFDNGNGRLIRMFTYALLIKQGFQVKAGRIINPTAIFCMDRQHYYDMLELADSGEKENVLAWCEYVLTGLKSEIEKIDRLLDRDYLLKVILQPTLNFALERKFITEQEFAILRTVISDQEMCVKSADLKKILAGESSVQRSRIIKRLREKTMLIPLTKNGRIYTIGFANNFLLRGIIQILEQNSFIPRSLNQNR